MCREREGGERWSLCVEREGERWSLCVEREGERWSLCVEREGERWSLCVEREGERWSLCVEREGERWSLCVERGREEELVCRERGREVELVCAHLAVPDHQLAVNSSGTELGGVLASIGRVHRDLTKAVESKPETEENISIINVIEDNCFLFTTKTFT